MSVEWRLARQYFEITTKCTLMYIKRGDILFSHVLNMRAPWHCLVTQMNKYLPSGSKRMHAVAIFARFNNALKIKVHRLHSFCIALSDAANLWLVYRMDPVANSGTQWTGILITSLYIHNMQYPHRCKEILISTRRTKTKPAGLSPSCSLPTHTSVLAVYQNKKQPP